jgi:hypothetical protein
LSALLVAGVWWSRRGPDRGAVPAPLVVKRCRARRHTLKVYLGACTLWLTGCVVILGVVGAAVTVSVALPLVVLPTALLTTTENTAPLSALLVGGVL